MTRQDFAQSIRRKALSLECESDALRKIASCIERGEDYSEYAWRTDVAIPTEFELERDMQQRQLDWEHKREIEEGVKTA